MAVRLGTTHEDSDANDRSVLGESFAATPLVLPVRGHLDSIKRPLKGDLYIGRGSRQRSLGKSRYCNTYKVSQYGRPMAISKFRETMLADKGLHRSCGQFQVRDWSATAGSRRIVMATFSSKSSGRCTRMLTTTRSDIVFLQNPRS